MGWVLVVALVLIAPNPLRASESMSPAQVEKQMYNSCIKSGDEDTVEAMKPYCRCSAKGIAAAIRPSELAAMAQSAGKNASQEEIGKSLMADGRFMGVIQRCLGEPLGAGKRGGE